MSTILKTPESGYTYGTNQNVHILDCAGCGITFGITEAYEERRRNDHQEFYCPNGHPNVYNGKNTEEKLRASLTRERERAARLAAEADQAKADARAQKAAKTRIKNSRDRERRRVGHGVCPCCTRSFANLKAHMERQHPEHATPETDE